ncbi:hypothetical protein HPULCUR_012175 [Helicostylum pulchrum]|uniref:DNA/RNA-binding domain-containing protein n=1 Tax=Helicostylum pulchrum TaxID=562976 RepID=A0ABP9YIE1_9FUNG
MQTSELNKPPTQRRRRRRRPKNRRKQKERDESSTQSVLQTKKNLDLTDLASEAHALEKQLTSLRKQLSINYSSMPSKEQGRMAIAIAAEQISTTEEEINYVRKSLKAAYRRIFAIDLIYATTHFIEEKLWGFIFYAEIEQVRSKLRKCAPDANETKVLQKELYRRIDAAFKFYRELNSHVKSVHHVDTKMLGIELLGQKDGDEKVGTLLQFNYICMGDLARYNAQQAMAAKSKKKTAEFWSLAKTCYLKAIDVYRENGKPYSQLALVSIYNGNAMDVVWYYCMSLAVKYRSSVGKDNLKSFYSKIKLNTKPKDHQPEDATSQLSQFVELFLHMHRTVMFNQKASEEFATMMPLSNELGTTLSFIIQSEQNEDPCLSKSTTSLLHIVRTTLTRIVTILMISIWITGERLKDNEEYALRPVILASQIHMLTFTFHLLSGVYRSSRQALEQVRESLNAEKYEKLESMLDEALLPGLSIWASYLSTNTTALAQYCTTASNDVRNREPEKKDLAKSVQSLLSIIISHPSFPDPVLNVLPSTYPLSEDLLLLGLVPLSRFHTKVDFFKETVYEAEEQKTSQARKQVRWGRIRDMTKKLADSNAFDFIQYNQAEQKYSVIDENAKRQQQGRFMKALATQRLIEQISSLEKNVDRITLSGDKRGESAAAAAAVDRQVYTCVVDVTAFLDGLNKVKRWVTQPLNADRRTQPSIMEVVVPLEVLNSLDDLKKGTSSESRLVRESIRFLDQQSSTKMDGVPHRSFLRMQKFDEKFNWQEEVEQFWIGEESMSFVDTILSEEEEEVSDVESDQSSDSELIKRRRGDDSDESEESESEEEEEDKDEEFDYSETFEEEEEEIPYTYEDVPKEYRTIINCMLYCLHKRQQQATKEESPPQGSLVLVTNDENLAWWAELFGDPKTGRRLQVETVDQWDKMVGKTIR